ncbi:MAG TPA: L-threonylcarbamoyladenylate synthase [Gammaproteobacteria bacterium]|nr:L-threonylcarbamoyladenylate synthase [Gammaproteobacteria bacterium]
MNSISTAHKVIRNGGVIAYPTEAVYGLGCDPWNESAVHKILGLKQRDINQGLIVIAADFAQLEPLLKPLPENIRQHVFATWPGPVTWLIPASDACPRWLTGEHATLAVRVSAHPLVQTLCQQTGPLVSTSANPHGQPPARDAQTVRRYFADRIDYIVEGEVGGSEKPSEIRDAVSGAIIRH